MWATVDICNKTDQIKQSPNGRMRKFAQSGHTAYIETMLSLVNQKKVKGFAMFCCICVFSSEKDTSLNFLVNVECLFFKRIALLSLSLLFFPVKKFFLLKNLNS
jgi:hypothetical protein